MVSRCIEYNFEIELFNKANSVIAPLWQVTSSWCGAGDGFHSCQQKACENFSINNTLPCQQIMLFHCVLSGFGNILSVSFFVLVLKNSIVSMMNLQRILSGAFWFTFSIQISLISLCSPWENSVTDHINTVLTKSEFQLSPASPVAQSDVSIRQLSVTVSFVRRNRFASDKKWFSPASFLLLIAWNSETHWLTSFDTTLIDLDRRWTYSADYDSCSLISDASWSISLSQAGAPSLGLLVLVIFSSVWKTRFKFVNVSINYFDPSTCHLSANMNAVQHKK